MRLPDVEIAYEKPVEEHFTNIAKTLISTSSSLQILNHATPRRGGHVEDLPSWVPDWSAKPLSVALDFLDLEKQNFRASKSRCHQPISSFDS